MSHITNNTQFYILANNSYSPTDFWTSIFKSLILRSKVSNVSLHPECQTDLSFWAVYVQLCLSVRLSVCLSVCPKFLSKIFKQGSATPARFGLVTNICSYILIWIHLLMGDKQILVCTCYQGSLSCYSGSISHYLGSVSRYLGSASCYFVDLVDFSLHMLFGITLLLFGIHLPLFWIHLQFFMIHICLFGIHLPLFGMLFAHVIWYPSPLLGSISRYLGSMSHSL